MIFVIKIQLFEKCNKYPVIAGLDANTEYTVWYFADGQVVSATGIVGADGVLVLNNAIVGVAR